MVGIQHFKFQHTCTIVMTAWPPWGSQDAGESSALPFLFTFPIFLHCLLESRYNKRDEIHNRVDLFCCSEVQKCNSNDHL